MWKEREERKREQQLDREEEREVAGRQGKGELHSLPFSFPLPFSSIERKGGKKERKREGKSRGNEREIEKGELEGNRGVGASEGSDGESMGVRMGEGKNRGK